ncbi:hypothetical protein LINPERPRIM_LOCUS13931 [Linum perenne]
MTEFQMSSKPHEVLSSLLTVIWISTTYMVAGDLRRLGSSQSMDERIKQLWDRFH